MKRQLSSSGVLNASDLVEEGSDSEEESEVSGRSKGEKRDRQWLMNFVRSTKTLTAEEWDKVKSEAVGGHGIIKSGNLESLVMIHCVVEKNLNLAHSLMQYHVQTHRQPSLVTLSKYIRLLGETNEEVNEEHMLSLCRQLTDRYKLLDGSTAEDLIVGLCRTFKWKDSLAYLEMMKLTLSNPTYKAVSVVAVRAFAAADYEVGWDLMTQLPRIQPSSGSPCEESINAWVEQCQKVSMSQRTPMILQLLHFVRDSEIVMKREVAEHIKYLFESSKLEEWTGQFTTISNRGVCEACNSNLESISLSSEEFEQLKSHFVERVIKGIDVYLKTSPAELERFLNFVRYTAPYSVVLDGLNVAYMMQKKFSNHLRYAKQLLNVVRHFKSGNRKVLVLGRQHMKLWPKEVFDQIKRESVVFFADDLSKDDPFLLYATLYSGQGTMFISKDMMRDHLFALSDPKLSLYFRKWQKAHQIEIITVLPNGNIFSKPPLVYNPIAQAIGNDWHIPFTEVVDDKPVQSWLCLKQLSFNHLSKPKLNVKHLLQMKYHK